MKIFLRFEDGMVEFKGIVENNLIGYDTEGRWLWFTPHSGLCDFGPYDQWLEEEGVLREKMLDRVSTVISNCNEGTHIIDCRDLGIRVRWNGGNCV